MLSLKHLSEIFMEMSNKIYMRKAGKYQSWNISEYTDGIQCLGTEWNEWRKEYKQRGVLKTDCGILQIFRGWKKEEDPTKEIHIAAKPEKCVWCPGYERKKSVSRWREW